MKLRDVIRTILSIAALLTILAGGTTGARLQEQAHACEGAAMAMAMDDCRDHRSDGSATDCATFVCAFGQTTLPAHGSPYRVIVATQSSRAAPRNDAQLDELRGPPDLRPPIA